MALTRESPRFITRPIKLAWLDVDGNTVVSSELSEDLRKWLPGPFSLGANLDAPTNKGSYRIALGIKTLGLINQPSDLRTI